MHSNDLEACGMKLCCFWFHSDVKFLTRSLYSGERQWPTWASCFSSIQKWMQFFSQSKRATHTKLNYSTMTVLPTWRKWTRSGMSLLFELTNFWQEGYQNSIGGRSFAVYDKACQSMYIAKHECEERFPCPSCNTVETFQGSCKHNLPPWGPGGLSRECAPPYPQRDRKRRLNGAVCRNPV